MAESFQAAHQIASESLGVQTVEVASAQVMVRLTVLKHVVDDLQNRMRNSNTGWGCPLE